MSSLQLTKKVVKVCHEGKEYLVAKPTARQIDEFSKSDSKTIEATINFLQVLGLPSEVSWNIDAESLSEVVQALVPKIAEKKS